ncbi:propionyl-coenzyme A carboxylase alpha polypeptide [Mesorhizobium sp. M00.F.Ca.ET.216.01.1.1]|nr:propionyl-coenzyme A carboxylase alpha polypeptide [Mesorhizobium sp. M00.F.Ca.ET.216.01.1.1]TJW40674.1 MAG: propionyl-coenzyme A carboxylase alpha polypeptide [Mesorhizobium sp.]
MPAISPSRGRSDSTSAFANLQCQETGETSNPPSSALEGQMSGRTEGARRNAEGCDR